MKPYYRREPTRLEEIAERVRVGKKVSAEDMRFYQERRRHGRVEVATAGKGKEAGADTVLVSVYDHHGGSTGSERRTQLHVDCTECVSI